jgi:hypothetical protein
MIKKKISFLPLFFCLFAFSQVQQNEKRIFTGGMFYHGGYVMNNRSHQQVKGISHGLGGKLAFHLGKHLRVGGEGYSSGYAYPGNHGSYKLGWGGLLAEFQTGTKKLVPVFSLTAGGGKVKDLYFVSGSVKDSNPDNVILRMNTMFLLTPSISLEYALTGHLNATLKADYIIGIDKPYKKDFVQGPRLYFGILFSR